MHLFLDEVKRPLPCRHQIRYVTAITQKCVLWQLLSHIKTHHVQCWLPGFTSFPQEYTCLTASLQTRERLHQLGDCHQSCQQGLTAYSGLPPFLTISSRSNGQRWAIIRARNGQMSRQWRLRQCQPPLLHPLLHCQCQRCLEGGALWLQQPSAVCGGSC